MHASRPGLAPSLFALGLALLLGTAATWLFLSSPGTPSPSSASDSSALLVADPGSSGAPGSSLPALAPWSWRDSDHPAPLAGATLSAVLAAWHGQRAPDRSPAAFATRVKSLRALLARLPSADFPRLLAPLATPAASPDDRRLRQIAFTVWIEIDPSAAARWAGTLPRLPDYEHSTLARQAFLAWAKTDVRTALAHSQTLPADRASSLAKDLFPLLAERDSAAAFRDFGTRLWNEGSGSWLLTRPLSAWAERDPAAALAWLLAQPRHTDQFLRQTIGELANSRADSAALATALATVPGLPVRQNILGDFLSKWNRKDSAAALAWITGLDPHLRIAILERTTWTPSNDRPELDLPLLLALPESNRRTTHLADSLGRWAKQNPSAALAWIRGHDDPGVAAATAKAHAAILGSIAQDEPATALAEWTALPEGPARNAAVATIAESWGLSDPAAALRWAAEHDLNRHGTFVEPKLLRAWAQKDPLAALRWAEARPPLNRAYTLSHLAGHGSEKLPRAATADLYSKIQDPALRAETLAAHLKEWITKDAPAAKTWLDTHDALTPEAAARLLAP